MSGKPIHTVLLDSHILMWAGEYVNKPDASKEKILIAKKLLNKLNHSGCSLNVSAISISEVLSGIYDPDTEEDFINNINKGYKFRPFDMQSARATAKIYRDNRKKIRKLRDELKQENIVGARKIIFGDLKILGTALANKIDMICTNDGGFIKLAKLINVQAVTPIDLIELLD